MTRFNEKTDTSSESIRTFADRLRKLATQFEYQADSMEKCGLRRIEVGYWKSVRTSLDGIGKFAGSIQEAITDAMLMADFDAMINNELVDELREANLEIKKKSEKRKRPS